MTSFLIRENFTTRGEITAVGSDMVSMVFYCIEVDIISQRRALALTLLHIQDHDRSPEIILELQLKTVQRDRFDINQQAVPANIGLLAADSRLQGEASFPLRDLHPVGMQQQPAGVLVEDQFLQE